MARQHLSFKKPISTTQDITKQMHAVRRLVLTLILGSDVLELRLQDRNVTSCNFAIKSDGQVLSNQGLDLLELRLLDRNVMACDLAIEADGQVLSNQGLDLLELHLRDRNVTACNIAIKTNGSYDKKKKCFVYTIFLPIHAFSKRQWHKKGSVSLRKCLSCINKFLMDSGGIGPILLRDHVMSNGLVGGNLHHVSVKKIRDHTMQCDLIDRNVAYKSYHEFLSRFQVCCMLVEDIAAFDK
jgi:hypothetical protein